MNDKPCRYLEHGRSSSFGTFSTASSLRVNQRRIGGTGSCDRLMSSYDERDIKIKERIDRLSMNLGTRERSSSFEIGTSRSHNDLLDPEQILLYINTGGKYNAEIFKRRNEYKEMVLDIYSVGGHCLRVMINSFKNILKNPKASNVNMTRMDRLVNFLSLVRDLHKNYCDPMVRNMFQVKSTKNENILRDNHKNHIDFSLEKRPKSTIYNKVTSDECTSNERNRRFMSADSSKKDPISSKVLLNIINDRNHRGKSEISGIYFRKLKENINSSRENNMVSHCRRYNSDNLSLYRRESKSSEQVRKTANVKDIFESLKESRCNEKKKEKLDLDTNRVENKHYNRNYNDSSVESELIANFLGYSHINKDSNNQRIASLQKLLDKLKEIKIDLSNKDSEYRERTLKSNQSSLRDSLSSSFNVISKIRSLSESDVIRDSNDISSGFNAETTISSPKDSDTLNSKTRQISNKRWELDTPFISHRTIDFDKVCNFNKSATNETKSILSLDKIYTSISPDICDKLKFEIPDVNFEGDFSNECKSSDKDLDESKSGYEEGLNFENKDGNQRLESSNLSQEILGLGSYTLKPLVSTIPPNMYVADDKQEVINIDNCNTKEKCEIEKGDKENMLITEIKQNGDEYKSGYVEAKHEYILVGDKYLNPPSEYSENISYFNDEAYQQATLKNDTDKDVFNNSADFPGENLSTYYNQTNNNSDVILFTHDKGKSVSSVSDKENERMGIEVESEKTFDMNVEHITIESNDHIQGVERLNIEYFTALNEYDLIKKIDEYNYWYDHTGDDHYLNLNMDGLNIDEFYYKGMESIPKCYDGPIDMSSSSIHKMCLIIYDNLPKLSSENVESGEVKTGIDRNLSILLRENVSEKTLLSFIHDTVMRDSRYLEFSSTIRRELSPPDDNFILLIIDLMRELLLEWLHSDSNSFGDTPMTIEIITKKVDCILKSSYEPYLSEVNSDEWVLKKVFHAPNYPNILESEKELLNIEHLFKYHRCEDLIASDYASMDRTKWLKISRYYLPLMNEAIEHVVQDLIDEIIVDISKFHLVPFEKNDQVPFFGNESFS